MSNQGPSSSLLPITEGPPALDSVLVAEDDPIFRHVLETWLTKWNYRVVAVDNGLEAWNLLQNVDAPHLLILDWMMPAVDGVELCRRLRSQRGGQPYCYVLLVTARDNKEDVVAGLDAGADDYLTKPFDVEELRARLRAGERILQLQDALLRAQQALQFEADHDPLTGLWNRGAILDLLRKETQRQQRSGVPIGVMMADLDHFKKINDTHGHLVGDSVLQACAQRLAGGVRAYDSVGRYGGEEFLIMVPGCDSHDLVASAERLRAAIANHEIQTTAGLLLVTISIGVVSSAGTSQAELDYESLLYQADEALYAAKANGRNRVEVASFAPAVRHS